MPWHGKISLCEIATLAILQRSKIREIGELDTRTSADLIDWCQTHLILRYQRSHALYFSLSLSLFLCWEAGRFNPQRIAKVSVQYKAIQLRIAAQINGPIGPGLWITRYTIESPFLQRANSFNTVQLLASNPVTCLDPNRFFAKFHNLSRHFICLFLQVQGCARRLGVCTILCSKIKFQKPNR